MSERDHRKHASGTGKKKGAPFRSPPQNDYLMFSESARIMLECLEINTREGVFMGHSKARLASLALVEAVTEEKRPCNVRLVGRVVEKVLRPYPLVRVKWIRAVSSLPPREFLHIMDTRYGFLLDVEGAKLDDSSFPAGTEFDFEHRLLAPRKVDTARGSTSRPDYSLDPEDLRRFAELEADSVRDHLGIGTTVSLRTSKATDE
jgi:hypothetical protein